MTTELPRSAPPRFGQTYRGQTAVLATMHAKERALARPLRAGCGLATLVPQGFDTDRFGSFSGEVAREASALDTARAKARAAMQATGLSLGIASEGSYGPHPATPLIACGQELVVFLDDTRGIEVVEQLQTHDTNYRTAIVSNTGEVGAFLEHARLPTHGVVVRREHLEPGEKAYKGLRDAGEIREHVALLLSSGNDRVLLQTDMRAHQNPTRMGQIRRVAFRLARRLATPCPRCAAPGFGMTGVAYGLPCAWCGGETSMVRGEVHACSACGFRALTPRRDGRSEADPGACPLCNP